MFFQYFLQKLYNSYNHCPCPRLAHVAVSWSLVPLQVLSNNGSQMFMSELKPCLREIATDKMQQGKKMRQHKIVLVSTLTGSVPRKMAKVL